MNTSPMPAALAELNQLWPRLDPFLQDGFRDFVTRWTHSWQNYYPGMDDKERETFLADMGRQMQEKVVAAREALAMAGDPPVA